MYVHSILLPSSSIFFFFNDTATTEIYTLSLHDALPIYPIRGSGIQPAGLDHTTINPVVNHMRADPKTLGHLLDGQLLRTDERGFGNLIAITDPLDHRSAEGFAESADLPFSIQGLGDFAIG